MKETAEEGPLKSLPGLTREKFMETCDLTPDEVKEICEAVEKMKAKMDEAIASSKRAVSDAAHKELVVLELQDAVDVIDALIAKYGAHRPGIAPLIILKSLASITMISVRMS